MPYNKNQQDNINKYNNRWEHISVYNNTTNSNNNNQIYYISNRFEMESNNILRFDLLSVDKVMNNIIKKLNEELTIYYII